MWFLSHTSCISSDRRMATILRCVFLSLERWPLLHAELQHEEVHEHSQDVN